MTPPSAPPSLNTPSPIPPRLCIAHRIPRSAPLPVPAPLHILLYLRYSVRSERISHFHLVRNSRTLRQLPLQWARIGCVSPDPTDSRILPSAPTPTPRRCKQFFSVLHTVLLPPL